MGGQNGKGNHHLYASKMILVLLIYVVYFLAFLCNLLWGYFRQCKDIYNCIYNRKIDYGKHNIFHQVSLKICSYFNADATSSPAV